jgi:hypothetical protein
MTQRSVPSPCRNQRFVNFPAVNMVNACKPPGLSMSVFRPGLIFAAILSASPALSSNFEFLAAPEVTLNRLYRLDRVTGEVGACQYGLKDNSAGVTLCYPAGEGAGPQPPGEFALAASRHEKESGVFRVNRRDGTMSICYVLNDKVVCTPPGK